MLNENEAKKEKKLPDMKIVLEAWKLEEHTMTITSSEKRFPKKYRYSLCTKIQNTTLEIACSLLEANEIDLRDRERRKERFDFQNTVMRKCKVLMHLIELSSRLKIISYDSFEYWARMANNIKNMCAKWQMSDLTRIKNIDNNINKGGGL